MPEPQRLPKRLRARDADQRRTDTWWRPVPSLDADEPEFPNNSEKWTDWGWPERTTR